MKEGHFTVGLITLTSTWREREWLNRTVTCRPPPNLLRLDPQHSALLLAVRPQVPHLVLAPVELLLQPGLLPALPLQGPPQALLVAAQPLDLSLQVGNATLALEAILNQPLGFLHTCRQHKAHSRWRELSHQPTFSCSFQNIM